MIKKVKIISEIIELGDTPRKGLDIQDVGLGMIRARMNNKVLHIKDLIINSASAGCNILSEIINDYPNHLIYLATGDVESDSKSILDLLEQLCTQNEFKNVNDKIGPHEFKKNFIALNEPGKKLINSLYN